MMWGLKKTNLIQVSQSWTSNRIFYLHRFLGKVCDRRWYERNKHIFPASRWEIYDSSVDRTQKYTIHGEEVVKK